MTTSVRRGGSLLTVTAICAVLTACGGEPSEADMKKAIQGRFDDVNAEMKAVGAAIGKELVITVKAFKKLGCVKAEGNPGYTCDFEMTMDGPLGEQSQKASGRFTASDKGWAVLEK
ncbi:conserved hypothetical protein [Candidatus Terasakiella magnetica]|nr:conserved hypothetical protein [Candidatus Terasakiella magnetica]